MVDSSDRHSSRLLMTLTGHENEINSVSYSPDGQLLVSGSKDGTVRIWNTRTGEETMSPLRSGDGNVLSVAFAPNGFRIASGTSSGVVHVWEVSTGCAALQPLRGHSAQIRSVTFRPIVCSLHRRLTTRRFAFGTPRPVTRSLCCWGIRTESTRSQSRPMVSSLHLRRSIRLSGSGPCALARLLALHSPALMLA